MSTVANHHSDQQQQPPHNDNVSSSAAPLTTIQQPTTHNHGGGQQNDGGDRQAMAAVIENLKNDGLNVGEIWFLIELHWYQKMMDYLRGKSDDPGPIDNAGLLDETGTKLKEGLQDELDYVLLPEKAWNMLVEKFTVTQGQTPIPRKVIENGMFVKHQQVEVYPFVLALKLAGSNSQPVEISVSRAATAADLRREARKQLALGSSSAIRLFLPRENEEPPELIGEEKSHVSLTDLCVSSNQVVIVDVELNGKWNVDLDKDTNNSDTPGPSGLSSTSGAGTFNKPGAFGNVGGGGMTAAHTPGLCGLSNLGNTCFMNSALQCLMNAGPLTDYFLSGTYKCEVNESNPLGMHGEVAQAFGDLCQAVWSGRFGSFVPRAFKLTVGRFAPQFSGYQQQDSQELMAFLLDGLHEDLNRIRQKPYIEAKESSDDTPDDAVAEEAWSNYKKRNDSVIVDLFHGLLKSTVVCPECNKVSVTFDPFCYLSLPMPAKKERQVLANFVPADPAKAICKYKVTVPKNGNVKDLTDATGRLFGTDPAKLVIGEVYGNRVYKFLENDSPLSVIMDRDELYVYELDPVPDAADEPTLVVFYNRVEKKGYFAHSAPQMTLVGAPMLAVLPKKLLDEPSLKTAAERAFKRFLSLPPPGETWWQSADSSGSDSGVEENGEPVSVDVDSPMDEDDGGVRSDRSQGHGQGQSQSQGQGQSQSPGRGRSQGQGQSQSLYTLRVVNSQGTCELAGTASLIKQTTAQTGGSTSGEPADPIYVALDWHPAAVEKCLSLDMQEHLNQHESLMLDAKTAAKKCLCLGDCLDLFTTTEKLGQDDLWYCPRCKKHQQATKKFDLWSLPDILMIHLKRFSYTRVWRDKIEAMVEYPLRELDLTKWLINKKHPNCVYDLIAVSNHYGGLGGGHYTAYAKNKRTGKWYSFDDSHVSEIAEEDAVTKSGYVLVYLRRRGTATIDATTDPNVEMEDGD